MGITLALLSGLIGAISGVLLTILFTLWRDNKEEKRTIAREKLEKVYGPLVALQNKIDLVNGHKGGFLRPSNPAENELIEKIIFHYYHLVDDGLKEGIILLHPNLSKNYVNQVKINKLKIVDKIFKYYKENKNILGLR